MIKISWNQVLTTVISTFLAALIISASAVVWKGATSVDDKVQKATSNVESTVDYLQSAIDVIEKEISTSRKKEVELQHSIDKMKEAISQLQIIANPPTNQVRRTPKFKLKEVIPPRLPDVGQRTPIQQQLPDFRLAK